MASQQQIKDQERKVCVREKAVLAHEVALLISSASQDAIRQRGCFTVAFSGGSLPAIIAEGFAAIVDGAQVKQWAVEFDKWKVYFADERCVPLDHKDSNCLAVKQLLLDQIGKAGACPLLAQSRPFPSSQLYTIDPTLLADPVAAAQKYQDVMRTTLPSSSSSSPSAAAGDQGIPVLDMVLLGMGEDGHTCSLFPGHALLEERKKCVAAIFDSPKPPSTRITLTYPVLEHAGHVVFVCTGAGKKEILPRVLAGKEGLPAGRVVAGKLSWYVDPAAAALLENEKKEARL